MSRKIDFTMMSLCDRISVTSDYIDVVRIEFNKYGIRFYIVGITLYSFAGLIYCYQVQTKQFHKGKWQEGLYLNNLFENEFLSLLSDLRNND